MPSGRQSVSPARSMACSSISKASSSPRQRLTEKAGVMKLAVGVERYGRPATVPLIMPPPPAPPLPRKKGPTSPTKMPCWAGVAKPAPRSARSEPGSPSIGAMSPVLSAFFPAGALAWNLGLDASVAAVPLLAHMAIWPTAAALPALTRANSAASGRSSALRSMVLKRSTFPKYRLRNSIEHSFWKRSVPGMPGARKPTKLGSPLSGMTPLTFISALKEP